MNQNLLDLFGTAEERVQKAIAAFSSGTGAIVVDDENRENEGDLIYPAVSLTVEQTARMIRDCSGIICLCLPEWKVRELGLPMMVEQNTSSYGTGFTVTIEAAAGVTTGVSAADRTQTIKTAIADNAKPSDLNRPGHVFPLRGRDGGVLVRQGHTEASIDLATMAGLKPYGVLCELTNPDGSMMRLPELVKYAKQNHITIVSINDIVAHRQKEMLAASR